MSFIKDEIPKITDPMGKHWEQPELSEIILHMSRAVMDKKAFNLLKDYSRTNPSGVYVGKMWKARMLDGSWKLRWYSPGDSSEYLCVKQRTIALK